MGMRKKGQLDRNGPRPLFQYAVHAAAETLHHLAYFCTHTLCSSRGYRWRKSLWGGFTQNTFPRESRTVSIRNDHLDTANIPRQKKVCFPYQY